MSIIINIDYAVGNNVKINKKQKEPVVHLAVVVHYANIDSLRLGKGKRGRVLYF